MSAAGTLNTDYARVGISASEIVDIARATIDNPWLSDGCAAFVWGVTNLAGAPFLDNRNMTEGGDPSQPRDDSYVVPHASYNNLGGDGWTTIATGASASDLKASVSVGDVVRVYKSGNTSEGSFVNGAAAAHSFIVSKIEGNTIYVIDNWSGGKITEHSIDVIVNAFASGGSFQSFYVARLDQAYVDDNFSQDLAGNGFGDFNFETDPGIVPTDGDDDLSGTSEADSVHCQDGDDTIVGQEGNDTLWGDSGNDNIYGGLGEDSLAGGLDADDIRGEEDADTIQGEEGDDTIYGGAGSDDVHGGDDDDAVYGEDDSDVLYGDFGDDTVFGGTGDDEVRGGEGADSLIGEDGDDELHGEGEDDQIFGSDGSDDLWGDAGDDTLDGGEGNDYFNGGGGTDVVTYAASLSGVTVQLVDSGMGNASGNDTGNDLIEDVDNVVGSSLGDTLGGNSFENLLIGGAGADSIRGHDGADTLTGSGGNDTLLGDDGDDRVVAGGSGDLLQGGSGADSLFGGIGRDILRGEDGKDFLSGGAGADRFEFSANMGADEIFRFQDDVDILVLNASLWGGAALSKQDVLDQFASVVSGHLVFDFGSGNTVSIGGLRSVSAILDDLALT